MRVLVIGLDGRVTQPETETYAVRWAREMARLVDEYVVLSEARLGGGCGPVTLAPNATAYGVASSPTAYSFRALGLAMRLHRQSPFDLCTTEDPFRAGLAGAMFAARTGVPLNVENHSLQIDNEDWLRLAPRNRVYNKIGIAIVRRADTIRNYSPDQNEALQRAGVPSRSIFVIPPPSPPPLQAERNPSRSLLGLGRDELIIASAGRMVPVKDLGTLLRAFSMVRDPRPKRLILAGDGPSRADWERDAKKLGIADRVTWLGDLGEAEMAALYGAADVFVCSSLHETGPRTVLEAFASGCPVIGTSHLGVTHSGILCHDETGLVTIPRDAEGMAKSIEVILSDPAWAQSLVAEARRRLKSFDSPSIARRVYAMFCETQRRAGRSTGEMEAAGGPVPAHGEPDSSVADSTPSAEASYP